MSVNPTVRTIQDETIGIWSKYIRRGAQVALIDFPSHRNSGDSLIYLGEMAYLRHLDVKVAFLCDVSRYDPASIRRALPEGPILLHGGGNLGDRWTHFQEFRERVISDFTDRQVIQLPQGVEFSDPAAITRAKGVFDAHPNLVLMLREQRSLQRATELFPHAECVFSPDAAFGVGTLKSSGVARVDVVGILRGDSEAIRSSDFSIPEEFSNRVTDWGLGGVLELAWKALRIPGAVVKRVPALGNVMQPLLRACFDAMARLNVRNAVRILSQGRIVVTDRLHATVMCALMGKDVVALDNANGKISSIIDQYLGRSEFVHFAADGRQAQGEIRRIMSR